MKPRGTEVRRPFVLRVLPDRFALFQTRAWAFAPKPPKFRDHPSTATRCSASWRSPVVMVSPNHDHDAVATDDGSRLCGSAPGVLAQHSDDGLRHSCLVAPACLVGVHGGPPFTRSPKAKPRAGPESGKGPTCCLPAFGIASAADWPSRSGDLLVRGRRRALSRRGARDESQRAVMRQRLGGDTSQVEDGLQSPSRAHGSREAQRR